MKPYIRAFRVNVEDLDKATEEMNLFYGEPHRSRVIEVRVIGHEAMVIVEMHGDEHSIKNNWLYVKK